MSTIEATAAEKEEFTKLLADICRVQALLSKTLDDINIQLSMPGQSVLRLLGQMVAPMGRDLQHIDHQVQRKI